MITEPVETEITSTTAPLEVDTAPEEEIIPGEEAVEEYTPNYGFKVLDEEKQFDEFLQGAVTTKEQEDALRDLYTKAHGLDSVKGKFDTLNKELDDKWKPMESQHTELQTGLTNLGNLIKGEEYAGRDYQTFFDTLKIPKQHVLQYAKSILDYQDMEPAQRQQLDNQRMTEQQNAAMVAQNEGYQSQLQEQAIQTRGLQINMEFNKPEINSFTQDFDTRAGKPGSFREQVLNEGAMYFQQNGHEAAPDLLVKAVMDKWQPFVGTGTPTNPATPQAAPVIPNVKGTGNSPARKQISSLADLRAIRNKIK